MTRILGIGGSLRNARHGKGSKLLIDSLRSAKTRQELKALLETETRLIVEDFLAAGRADGKPFDQIYKSLRSMSGTRGLSNSEAVLAASLWGALQEGAELDHMSLATHFPPTGEIRDPQGIRKKLLAADGVIISTPVYFGDRGSLVQSLLDFIASDATLKEKLAGKVYGGLAVGAKRNGGQETTLIYQMLDMVNLGFMCVGNASDTTAQYGGTAVAGDVGSAQKDDYGLETAIGTGERVAKVAKLGKAATHGATLQDRLVLDLWLLQRDSGSKGLRFFGEWAKQFMQAHPDVLVRLWDIAGEQVVRCIACDICPIEVGAKEDYRCIITKKEDFFVRHHSDLVKADAILVCAYSPEDRSSVVSLYQQFIERTRYLRRDNYAFNDLLVAPFVVSELEARQNLHLRMLTSMVRHHTILAHPLLGMIVNGELLNKERVSAFADRFVSLAKQYLLGRLLHEGRTDVLYNPVGYSISAEKAQYDSESGNTRVAVAANKAAHLAVRKNRVASGDDRA